MKLTKKQELEVMQVYDTWMNSYLNGDVKTYDSFLDDGYRFIGSTDNEEFLNRKDTTQFFKNTAEQFSGKTDLRKQTTTIEAFDDLIFITHLFDAWFINGSDWTYYGRFRFSSVLQEKKEGWKFIYQHFSIADSKTDEGETIGFDKVNEENQELREAIKRRTIELEAKNRELEIEGALGRIRAQATAMKESSELLDIVVAIRNEFTRLGHEAGYFWHMMWLPKTYEKAMTSGDGSKVGFVMKLPKHMHGDIPLLAKWEKSKKPTVVYAMDAEEAIDYVDKMIMLGDFQNIDPQAPSHDDIRHIDGLTFIMARTSHGEIGYSLPGVVKNPPAEDLDILVQFAGAFDLAHRRFLDLQKAERQAREVQIELALEKVRSRTMGMQRSDELRDTAMLLFQQVEELGINSFACGFNIWDDDKKAATAWMAGKDRLQPPFKTNSAEDVYLLFYEAEKRGESLFILEQEGKKLEDHYKYLVTIPEVKKLSEAGLSFPTFQIIHCAYFSKGYLMFITLEPVPDAHDIFKRFAKVFEQTYTRFLDLQKAEAQAREAQIETSLERVRSRTMAMQHSDELAETSYLLDQQVRALGIKTWGCAFNIYGENESTEWFGNEAGVLPTYTVPRTGIFKKYYQKGQKGESLHIEEFSGDECVSHYEYMSSLPVIGKVLKKLKATNKGFPTYQIDHVVYFKYGYLLFITKEDVPEAHDVFKRFAKVFEQTYTRFLDLQKAEAQAREALIETALERVRSQSMGMQTSKDFSKVTTEMFNQLRQFNGDLYATGIVFCDKHKGHIEQWHSVPNAGMMSPFIVPIDLDYIHQYRYDQWKKGTELFSIEIPSDFIDQHFNDIFKLPSAQVVLKEFEANKTPMPPTPDWEIDYGASFKNGYLLVSSLQPFKEAEILPRFAKVFEQTYTRFLDLQKAEAQAKEAQIEAALERVRAQSMAMHTSDELKDVVRLIFDQMGQININAEHAGIVVDYEPKKDWHFWVAETRDIPAKITVPNLDLIWDRQFAEAKKNSKKLFTTRLNFEEKNAFYKELLPHIEGLTQEMQDHYFERDGLAISTALQKDIGLYIENFSGIPYTEEENSILLRFAQVFQQTYTRFLDLKKAEAQAREAQIEASLERVRASAMAMHKSDDLTNSVDTVFSELKQLGFNTVRCGIGIFNDKSNNVNVWTTSSDRKEEKASLSGDEKLEGHPLLEGIYKAWTNQVDYSYTLKDKDLENYYKHVSESNLPVSAPNDDHKVTTQYYHVVNFPAGGLFAFSDTEFSDDKKLLMKRFGEVFHLSFTRHLDLKQAEAQAREAQIEAALEKVRSRTMAMQTGEEVKDVVVLLYKELIKLGVTNFASCGYVEINEEINRQETWVTNPGGDSLGLFYLPLTGDVHFDARYEAWKNKQTVFHQTVAGIERRKHLEYAITTFNSKEAEEMVLTQFPDPTVFYCFNFSHGYLHLVAGSHMTKDEEILLARFTKVFEQTYARFLDLKKAEAQAREAQIENALEKVRSRSLAMHKPDELQEVITVVAEKLQQLGVVFDVGGVILCTYFPDNKDVVHWIASPDLSSSQSYLVPYFDNPIFNESWDSKNQGDDYFSKEFPVEAKNHFFEYAFKHSDYRHFPDDYKQHVLEAEKHNLSAAWSKNSAILIPSLTGVVPSENDADIMKRFAKVFEQAYIRFMDLQKAEAQARESQIEAALEKVRSRTMAMQHSDELPEAANNLFLQVQALGIPAWSAGYCIWEENQKSALCHMSSEGEVQKAFSLPTIGEGYNFYDPYKKGETFHISECGGENLVKHYDFMKTLPTVGVIFEELEKAGLSLPTFQIFHIVFFKFGYVMFITYETVPDAHHIFKRFGQVFEQTYTRFLDLKLKEDQAVKLEEEKRRLEKTLKDLQETQKQLIQSEKMASLGELTAGIAHEIQNPLNFVNNFSEVSVELIEEMHEELEKGDLEEAIAISEDVKQNLEKINHHGKRADGIVKGMLQHSRSSSGQKEPTDINALADEYLRLAYHGLRAKDKSFNATLETDYDDEIGKIEIIPQDIGRVILNLITNAFYVVKEKNSNGFEPTVTVSTKKKGKMVLVSVKDNGNGIPKEVLDKIFQPFFTTKPTGKGTGLGLSMSYDIVTKGHGGELKVETKEGKETTFTIVLPIG